jgi:hypothetical protein
MNANRDANPELSRLALKLATGAGKTTVMAMIIAWQTINERVAGVLFSDVLSPASVATPGGRPN